MNVLSLFDGISVAKLALDNLGIENEYVAAEIDKYPTYISEKHYPDLFRYENVREIEAEDFDEPIDLLVGGSPCQGFSLQGLQMGLEDPRSGLVSEYIRLKNELKPKFFLLENVKMKAECRDFISEQLGVQPYEINSLEFVPQSRQRLYWTNIPLGVYIARNYDIEDYVPDGYCPGTARKGPPRHVVFTDHFGCLTASYYKGVRADGRPLLTKAEGIYDDILDQFRKLTPEECEALQGLPEGYTTGVSNTQRYKALGNAFTLPVIQYIFEGLK
jgi:site-specific DNA-cytosine methylase